MSAFTVRIPEELHRELRKLAESEQRSINNLMIKLWTEALNEREAKSLDPRRKKS
jgi:predicted HicB family RNase H-like nuclease